MINKFVKDVSAFGPNFKLDKYWAKQFKKEGIRVCKMCLSPKYERAFTGNNEKCKCCAKPAPDAVNKKARHAHRKAWRDNCKRPTTEGIFCEL